MYLYIYDEFIQDKRFEKDILQIENRLTDLGIAGKVARLALFRDPAEMIRDEVRRGVTTVVVVGNDRTVHKVLEALAKEKVVLGLIPLGSPLALAETLGVPVGLAACDVLSARIVEAVDLGTVNGRRFLHGIFAPKFQAEIACEGFRVTPNAPGMLEILNLGAGRDPTVGYAADPCDNRLEVVLHVPLPVGWNVFKRGKVGTSVVPAKAIVLSHAQPMILFADGEELTSTRFDIGIDPRSLKLITSRNRKFGAGSHG